MFDPGTGATAPARAFEFVTPRSLKRIQTATSSLTALETRTSPARAFAATRAPT